MQSFPINWLALVVATLVKFLLGWVWYGAIPPFAKQWQESIGVTPEALRAGMVKAIVTDLVTTFIMAWVLVHAAHYAGATGWAQGAGVGFVNWLGFVGGPTLAATVYEHRPLKLWAITNGYMLLGLMLMGVIVTVWT
jgi:hypothetical protein